jgi:hypothetical protein
MHFMAVRARPRSCPDTGYRPATYFTEQIGETLKPEQTVNHLPGLMCKVSPRLDNRSGLFGVFFASRGALPFESRLGLGDSVLRTVRDRL